ncbi:MULTISPECIES: DUF2244 domain-containing protein [unclassified Ensifer]|uniref:DUF2244 domain-containing protein n=1 Tax=unclassified Ensifer TaxID=2633371 RepID=UPI0008132ED8|nr:MULTISPECIES: DUF2244 domain-containing protein [unclassified Ensifer]OCP20788.1 hypothetical protein BC361_28290 [Ensifer sp. LC54]OCP24417.1 hypothetical protein BC363_22790 [Ensifer sp. LC384]
MTNGNDQTLGGEEPVFSAELTPYRSLGLRGFKVFFLIAGLLSLVHAVVFMVIGAWPIVFFFGLDFALLFGAFWLNYRSARSREEVRVSRTDVSVRKFAPSGRMIEHRFNPFWARFSIARHQEIGIVSMSVSDRGQRTDVGSFLNRDDRETFATAFSLALATVRRR